MLRTDRIDGRSVYTAGATSSSPRLGPHGLGAVRAEAVALHNRSDFGITFRRQLSGNRQFVGSHRIVAMCRQSAS
jgi:hypothetical protein